MGQVLSLDIRSKLRKGILFAPALLQEGEEEKEEGGLKVKVQTDFRGEHVRDQHFERCN